MGLGLGLSLGQDQRNPVTPPLCDWLIRYGVWEDLGKWCDTEFWNDGV